MVTFKVVSDNRDLTEEEWKKQRDLGIGGSDAAAAVGLNPHKSRISLYLDKIGEGKQFDGNIHTRFGKRMEPIIREWFKEDYELKENIEIDVCEYPYAMQSIENPFMLANIDGTIIHPEYGKGIIEIKTASEMNKKQWQDEEIPDTYYCQIQHYMSVTGLNYCMIIALIGKELIWKYVPRNDEFIKSLIEREREFWDCVINKTIPEPDGADSSKEALLLLYPAENKDEVLDLSFMKNKRERFKEISTQIKELNKEQEQIKQEIMLEMGTAEIAMIEDKKVTWKTIVKKAYSVAESSSRQLRIY